MVELISFLWQVFIVVCQLVLIAGAVCGAWLMLKELVEDKE